MRVVAVDWSGRVKGERRHIWLAEVREGRLTRLERGLTREQVVGELVEMASQREPMVVGLDFAFPLPAWFVKQQGCASGPELWAKMVDEDLGEQWLAACESPFWGHDGTKQPFGHEQFRATEKATAAVGGIRPKSVFQINGGGSVGTGSLRGMPCLHALATAGVAIWPFVRSGQATAVEIYPRILTGSVIKKDGQERRRYLVRWPDLQLDLREKAAGSEDAFDAAVSALVMWAHRDELASLRSPVGETDRLEGAIWAPSCADGADRCSRPGCARSPGVGVVEVCPFCSPVASRVFYEDELVLGLWDGYPVAAGHALVVTRRHVGGWFGASGAERAALMAGVELARGAILERFGADGFNIGINDGVAAGQTVGHVHVHVIPRRTGDVVDPRGGVRWVLPERADYWSGRSGE